MINKDTLVKVTNKYNGTVGYDVPDTNIHRNFFPNETKEVTYDELERVYYAPGGAIILKEYLEIKNEEVINSLFYNKPEPEYHYTKQDVKQILETGPLDQFLDLLDFAPEAIKEMVKDIAVDLPLNDVAKRQAIAEKLGFDVTKAIEIKNTKFDGGDEDTNEGYGKLNRRTAPLKEKAAPAPSGRRYVPTKE